MHADLDTLLTTVYCMADDLLPCKPNNARRRVTDAEVVTLCVAQAIMGIPSDERFLRPPAAPSGLLSEAPKAARLLEAPPAPGGDDRAPRHPRRGGVPRRRR